MTERVSTESMIMDRTSAYGLARRQWLSTLEDVRKLPTAKVAH